MGIFLKHTHTHTYTHTHRRTHAHTHTELCTSLSHDLSVTFRLRGETYTHTNTLINEILWAQAPKVGMKLWKLGQSFGSWESKSGQIDTEQRG